MKLRKMTAAALTALLFAAGTAAADDHMKDANLTDFDNPRYNFHLEGANQMIFKNPVSFTGEVKEMTRSHRIIEAANGMAIKVPNQALLWNGDREMFAQTTAIGDEVVVHMRQEEGYRIMNESVTSDSWVAVGSYEGVFYFPKAFVRDIALSELDGDIYADNEDLDAEDIAYDDDDLEAVVVTDRDVTDNKVTVTGVNTYDDDKFDRYEMYDVDLKSVER